jgi:predicted nucleotidyltransferase
MLNNDYKEMLQCLSEENVKFLLVGAYAVAAYGFPRATKDIDILVRPTPDNASSLMKALSRFGAPLGGVSADDFSTEGVRVPVISLEDLIANKRATGRTQDMADVERLESIRPGE